MKESNPYRFRNSNSIQNCLTSVGRHLPLFGTQGETRTLNHLDLNQAAMPIRLPEHKSVEEDTGNDPDTL